MARGSGSNTLQGNFVGLNAGGLIVPGDQDHFATDGIILLNSSSNVIGGLTPMSRNIIVPKAFGQGVTVSGGTGNRIEGNFFGVDRSNKHDFTNGSGVYVSDGAKDTAIGGTTPAARNVISGCGYNGVTVVTSSDTFIVGNYFGTDITGKHGGATYANGTGIVVELRSSFTFIGGNTKGAGNVLSNSVTSSGVDVADATDTQIVGNNIGTNATGTIAMGNNIAGVWLTGPTAENVIESNIIKFNNGPGVDARGSSFENEITRNDIASNKGIGIDLEASTDHPIGSITPNDKGDVDEGSERSPELAGAQFRQARQWRNADQRDPEQRRQFAFPN